MNQLIMVTQTKAVYQDTEGTIRESQLKKDLLGNLYFLHGKVMCVLPSLFQPKS